MKLDPVTTTGCPAAPLVGDIDEITGAPPGVAAGAAEDEPDDTGVDCGDPGSTSLPEDELAGGNNTGRAECRDGRLDPARMFLAGRAGLDVDPPTVSTSARTRSKTPITPTNAAARRLNLRRVK